MNAPLKMSIPAWVWPIGGLLIGMIAAAVRVGATMERVETELQMIRFELCNRQPAPGSYYCMMVKRDPGLQAQVPQ